MNFRKPQQTGLVIADDHPIFRDGLRRLLESEDDFKVLGEASDGAEAVKLAQIVEALQLGARGVVLKDSATQVLLKAIQTVIAGEYWVHREPVSNLVQYLRTLMQSTHDEARQKKFGLTPRELEIVSAVVAGYSNKEIAEYFKISEDTVKHHLSNIFDKLGVSTRLELALFAVNQSLPLKSIA
jgi:DNA-binding NarL/FixJ family response regulator